MLPSELFVVMWFIPEKNANFLFLSSPNPNKKAVTYFMDEAKTYPYQAK